jgi:hypothetical protein
MISKEFYDLCQGFYEGKICMQSINGSHVVPIPKKDNPTRIGDYRPISLLNSSVKVLTKILANRLQKVILQLIHKNQYGFIKERNIQNCLTWAFEYLYLCKKSRKELIILKLIFEKAFDRIEHKAVMDILHHKGFNSKWQLWMKMIMDSGTSSILLNGVPGKVFHCKRGVRQGDPLSPLLFVLADDTLLFLEACPRQLLALKAMLNTFAASIGLRVNFQISNIYPINVDMEKWKF